MTLEELDAQIDVLADTIKQLAQKIMDGRPVLQKEHETSTRNVLINPLLQALGWDTTDRNKVRAESRISRGRADYILMNGDQQVALVEAKRLGEVPGTAQALEYCHRGDIRYMILTDGDHWDMYDLQKKGRLEEDQKVLAVKVSSQNPITIARKLISLSYRSLVNGKMLGPSGTVSPPPPIGASASEAVLPTAATVGAAFSAPTLSPATASVRTLSASPPPLPLVTSPVPRSGSWIAISALPEAKGPPPPKVLRFPDGTQKPIAYWRDVLVGAAEWLVSRGALTAARCPIGMSERGYIVNTDKRHASGKAFREPRPLSNGLWVETNVGTDRLLRQVKSLLAQCGQDADEVQVQL